MHRILRKPLIDQDNETCRSSCTAMDCGHGGDLFDSLVRFFVLPLRKSTAIIILNSCQLYWA